MTGLRRYRLKETFFELFNTFLNNSTRHVKRYMMESLLLQEVMYGPPNSGNFDDLE